MYKAERPVINSIFAIFFPNDVIAICKKINLSEFEDLAVISR